jgi:hypothetical protein
MDGVAVERTALAVNGLCELHFVVVEKRAAYSTDLQGRGGVIESDAIICKGTALPGEFRVVDDYSATEQAIDASNVIDIKGEGYAATDGKGLDNLLKAKSEQLSISIWPIP